VRRREWIPEAADRERLTEHLFHEVQMTFFLAGQLAAPVSSRVDVSLRNAEIEAFAIHLRQLVEFFWADRKRFGHDRASFAADYFPRDEWARLRPERPAIFARHLHVGIAPLTYSGDWVHPSENVWDLVSQAYALTPVVKRFAETVDAAQLTAGYAHGMRLCAEIFESAHAPGTTRTRRAA
jgi:hypothetical protein